VDRLENFSKNSPSSFSDHVGADAPFFFTVQAQRHGSAEKNEMGPLLETRLSGSRDFPGHVNFLVGGGRLEDPLDLRRRPAGPRPGLIMGGSSSIHMCLR